MSMLTTTIATSPRSMPSPTSPSNLASSSASAASSVQKSKTVGGFLPDTFLNQVEEFLEHTESDYDETSEQEEDDGLFIEDDDHVDITMPAPQSHVSPNLHVPQVSVPASTTALSETSCKLQDESANNNHLSVLPVDEQQQQQPSPLLPREELTQQQHQQHKKQPFPPHIAPKKSALKKVSSYNGLDDFWKDDNKEDIHTSKSAWITMPIPAMRRRSHKTAPTTTSNSVRRVGSSPALLPEQAPSQEQTNDETNATPTSRIKRNVSFTHVLVRDYPMTLGDNPSCTIGTPVALSWDYQSQAAVSFEDYEAHRPARRSRPEMRLDARQRTCILRAAGVSRGEIQQQEQNTARTRRQRASTITLLPLEPIEVLVESATRKMKRLRSGLGNKKKNNHLSPSACSMRRSQSANALCQKGSQ